MSENIVSKFYNTFQDDGKTSYYNQKSLLFSKNGLDYTIEKKNIRKLEQYFSSKNSSTISYLAVFFNKQMPKITVNTNKNDKYGLRFYYDSFLLFADEETTITINNKVSIHSKNTAFDNRQYLKFQGRQLIINNYKDEETFNLFNNEIVKSIHNNEPIVLNIKIKEEGKQRLIAEQQACFSANKVFMDSLQNEIIKPNLEDILRSKYEINKVQKLSKKLFNRKDGIYSKDDISEFSFKNYSKTKNVLKIIMELKKDNILNGNFRDANRVTNSYISVGKMIDRMMNEQMK